MKLKKLISSSLAIGLIFNSTSASFAGILSEDGRYETFEGNNITIDNILEEDKVDVEIEGNTMVNIANQKDPVPITKAYTVKGTNYIPLQGEYDGKARPVIEGNTMYYNNDTGELSDTFVEGSNLSLVSSFEDGYIPKNISTINNGLPFTVRSDSNNLGNRAILKDSNIKLKANTTYTIMIDVSNVQNDKKLSLSTISGVMYDTYITPKNGTNIVTITTNDTPSELWIYYANDVVASCVINQLVVLEGNWKSNLPSYDEIANYGGKYKVEYKVTGKNKFDGNLELGSIDKYSGVNIDGKLTGLRTINYIPVQSDTTYTLSNDMNYHYEVYYYDSNYKFISSVVNTSVVTPSNCKYIRFRTSQDRFENNFNVKFQLEEGSTTTEYEPYQESIKTFYLNSPLLEGDIIEDIDGKATHVRRSEKIVLDGSEDWAKGNVYGDSHQFVISRPSNMKSESAVMSNSLKSQHNVSEIGTCYSGTLYFNVFMPETTTIEYKQWLSENPMTVVYELAEPIYEIISEESILIDSYVNGHLYLNTSIPVNKVDFVPTTTNLNYLYPSTEYTVQFESDNEGKIDEVSLDDEILYSNYTVNKGVNRFNIITPSKISSIELILDGIGFNLSNLVTTEAVDESFDYFEGIKSVGQDDVNTNKIEIISLNNGNLIKGTTFTDGYYVKRTDGKPTEHSDFSYTDYIEVLSNKVIHIYNTNLNCAFYDENKNFVGITKPLTGDGYLTGGDGAFSILIPSNAKYVKFSIPIKNQSVAKACYIKNGALNKLVLLNKKEVLLNKPLRSLPNGVKDRIIKRNGQWVVERNCGEVILDGSNDELWSIDEEQSNGSNTKLYRATIGNIFEGVEYHIPISNTIPSVNPYNVDDSEGIIANSNHIRIRLFNSRIKTQNINELRKYLSQNPINVVHKLVTPIYEPLNIDSTINTYLDTTHISNNSTIPANMKVTIDRAINRAVKAIELAKTNPTVSNISEARYWTNLLKESIKKDELQSEINSITNIEDLQLERKTATSNVDVYIKSENMLLMSLSTNSITFEDYSGVEDMELNNAINISINSSLPYQLNSYLLSEIENSDKSNRIEKNLLNIKTNDDTNYKTFNDINEKLLLEYDCDAGNNKSHSIDLRLKGSQAHKADIYKTVIKFEAEQK